MRLYTCYPSRVSTLPQPRKLEDLVLDAFRRASDEDRLDVAEHLLCALETLAGRDEGGRRCSASQARLRQAYRVIARRADHRK